MPIDNFLNFYSFLKRLNRMLHQFLIQQKSDRFLKLLFQKFRIIFLGKFAEAIPFATTDLGHEHILKPPWLLFENWHKYAEFRIHQNIRMFLWKYFSVEVFLHRLVFHNMHRQKPALQTPTKLI